MVFAILALLLVVLASALPFSDVSYQDLHDKYSRQYRRNVLSYGRPFLRGYLGRGGVDAERMYRNRALGSEALGTRSAMDELAMATARNFGGNPSGLNSSLAVQAQLASKRPLIEVQSAEAGRLAMADALARLQGMEMGKPAYISGMLEPYFREEHLDILADSLFPPMQPEAEGGGFLGGLLGGL